MSAIRAVLIATAILGALALIFSVRSCIDQAGKAKLAGRQTTAAVESGRDAVQTTGNVAANAAARMNDVERGNDEIEKAPAGDSNDAALRAACRLRSYRDQPRCTQLLGPSP